MPVASLRKSDYVSHALLAERDVSDVCEGNAPRHAIQLWIFDHEVLLFSAQRFAFCRYLYKSDIMWPFWNSAMNFIIKHPSAWIPIATSLIVLAIMLIGIAVFGIPHREADEGTAAHLFQIWLVLEVIMVAFFGIKWLPQQPQQAFQALALQVVATLAAMSPVFLLGL
jgi:hypothetical protein